MNYKEAVNYVMNHPGKTVYAPWYGKGWSTGWHPSLCMLVDINPHTGTLLQHTEKDPRNECEWSEGKQPNDL